MAEDVLIIEAEQAVAESVAAALAERRWTSRTTGDGKEGLDMALRARPAAIVLCAELPKMSGYSICAKLKKDPSLRDIPLIFTSSEASESTFEHHKKLKVRADEYLSKPFDMPKLLELIGRHVSLDAPAEVEVEEEAVDLDDIVGPEPNGTLNEAEDPFDVNQAIAHAADSLDSALEAIADGPEPGLDLNSSVGVPMSVDEDEALTTVGAPPEHMDATDVLRRRIAELEERLDSEASMRRAAEDAQRDSQDKLTALSQIPANASQPPSGSSREVYNLKKELNHKDHELLELRDKLHSKDKEMLVLRDREMELEGRIVQAEEERDQEHATRTETERRLAATQSELDAARRNGEDLNQQLRGAERQIQVLNEEKSSLENERSELQNQVSFLQRAKADLEAAEKRLENQTADLGVQVSGLQDDLRSVEADREALQKAKAELESTKAQLEENKRSLETGLQELRNQNQSLANEKSSLEAEVESLRGQLNDLNRRYDTLSSSHTRTEKELASTQAEVEDLKSRLADTERRAELEYQRRGETEETALKARQAIEIALKMLHEIEVDNGAAGESLRS